MTFTHLHIHTHYSLLDGLTKVPDLVQKIKEDGGKAVAITDHGVMYGVVEFYQECKKQDIKPIIGMEAYVAPNGRHNKRAKVDEKNYHLVLLAKNNIGYKNLIQLVSKAHLEGFYYKPRIDQELLEKYHEGLICLTGCLKGEIPVLILSGQKDKAREKILHYKELFGPDNFYLEIQHHPNLRGQDTVNQALIKLGKELEVPLVATNDAHYLDKEDDEAQDILLCLQTKKKKKDTDRLSMLGDDYSVKPAYQMKEDFKDAPEAIENTNKVAEICNVEIKLGEYQLPSFRVPENYSDNDYLKKLCKEGVEKRYSQKYEELGEEKQKRLDYELSVISKMGFASYFLIVADFVNWAKDNGIVVGPGRGSAAGSFASYLLGITNIDPLQYDLLFERFLNPARVSMPDVDLDFADVRRDEVIKYVESKYGQDHVAQIITFSTMAARAAVRDVGRVLDEPYDYCDKIAKAIPMFSSIAKALRTPEFREIYQTEKEAKEIIDYAQRIENVIRHASVHACGVLITREPVTEYVPVQYASSEDKTAISQYSLHPIEDLGLLKMDFLGLANLTIIESAINIIKNTKGVEIDIDKIPLGDPKTFELLQKTETTGVFQLESSGMRRYLKELKPTVFEDIIAMVSLYRPGPMEWIPEYMAGKHGRKKPKYLHPKLEPILQKTYGVAIYQEQVMQIARDLAGFSMSEADILRKAVGKKIPKLLNEQKEKFVDGCVKNSVPSELAKEIFAFIEPFAGYGFNRCLTGDTTIVDAKSGKQWRLDELYKEYKNKKKILTVLTLKDNYSLGHGKITSVYNNGVKTVYEIKTRLGKSIRTTTNHPFKTLFSWKKLSELKVGDRIALARRLPINVKKYKIENYKLVVLGYLIAEGNLCHPQSFYYYTQDKQELLDYVKNLNKFKNTKATIDTSKPAISVYTGRINLKQKSEAVEWVKGIGIHYSRATNKKLPDFVFKLDKEQLNLLLGKMFQGDGCISLKRKYPQIFYATSSKELAQQLQHLLLRLDIITTIHTKKFKYRHTIKVGYTITINRYNNIYNFSIGPGKYLIGQKAKGIKQAVRERPILKGAIPAFSARGSKDIIPSAVRGLIVEKIKQRGYSLKGFAQKYKIAEGLFFHDVRKKGYLRETLKLIGQALGDKQIMELAESDIYWDEIVEIKKIGKEKTYDLTIENTHNFVANDFIVHNSHAACYALIGYQTAYLKANYPTEFMAALMTSDQEDIDRIPIEIEECQARGIEVLGPDVNESFADFTVVTKGTALNVAMAVQESKTIRFGLRAVKNVGAHITDVIIAERKANGPYKDMADFLNRVQDKDLNKKSLESLIKVGAFDKLEDRSKLLANLDKMLEYNRGLTQARDSGQDSLFSLTPELTVASTITLADAPPADKREMLGWEKELLGFYISDHPFNEYEKKLSQAIVPLSRVNTHLPNSFINVGGVIVNIKRIITRSNENMLFTKIEDKLSNIELLVFPSILKETSDLWQEGQAIICHGRISDKDNEFKIICDKVKKLEPNNAERVGAEFAKMNPSPTKVGVGAGPSPTKVGVGAGPSPTKVGVGAGSSSIPSERDGAEVEVGAEVNGLGAQHSVDSLGAKHPSVSKEGVSLGAEHPSGNGAQHPSGQSKLKTSSNLSTQDDQRVLGTEFGAESLKIKLENTNQELLNKLKEHLSANRGNSKVIFYVKNGNGGFSVIETGYRVDDNGELRKKLVELLGVDVVK